jgi:uncharacterized protein (TIGR02646 family)
LKYIRKGFAPSSLIAFQRSNPNPATCYEDYKDKDDHWDKEKWSKVLLQEQGYICAYTMKRISLGSGNMKREHIIEQNGTIANDINHGNVVAVCMGNEGYPPEEQYADTRKGYIYNKYGRVLQNINPCDPQCETKIKYRDTGEIYSENILVQEEIVDDKSRSHLSILNLNFQTLVDGRKGSYEAVKRILTNSAKGRNWKIHEIESMLEKFKNKDADGKFKEYCNFVIYRLQKELEWRRKS